MDLSLKNSKLKEDMKKLTFLSLVFITAFLTAQKPNVLFIISDDLNTRIGPYMEIANHTPHLDQLAAEGVRFTRTYCQYPLCGPSRASLMSGLYPETNGILRNIDQPGSYRVETPSLADHPSLAGYFRQQGYFTARVSKIYHMGVPGGIERGDPGGDEPDSWDYAYNVMGPETHSPGTLELLSPGNLHYGSNFARMIIEDGSEVTQADYLATSQAIAILENRAGELDTISRSKQKVKPLAPFFLAVGLVRPHVPLIAPENCFIPYPVDDVQLPPVIVADNVPEQALFRQNMKIWEMDELQKKKTISAYMASVRFMDQQVGRLLDALDRLGIREETIVVFVSDHGYNLGEHDCWSKQSLWEGSVRIPLIVSHPGSTKTHGTTCESITELIDLYPTLTELCGLHADQPDILQGKSLVRYLKGAYPPSDEALAYMVTHGGCAASIRTRQWRYTRWGELAEAGNEELYDHMQDPEEHSNLSHKPEMQEVLSDLREQFEQARNRAR